MKPAALGVIVMGIVMGGLLAVPPLHAAPLLHAATPRNGDLLSPVSGETGERPSAEEMAREGIEKLMQALELMIKEIPQYEMPEINERGDIIIRRKNPPETAPEDGTTPESEGDSTET